MKKNNKALIARAKEEAIKVLNYNSHGPYRGLPRTAAWGYPEPYTRDLLISSLGILISDNKKLMNCLGRVLETLAKNQSPLGHIPSLVHDAEDRGASDTTPLFIMTVALFRQVTGEAEFLESALKKALNWMSYQSPSDRILVAQMPTSDWRDEQWVLGYGLYVNTIVYTYLKLLRMQERAEQFKQAMSHFVIKGEIKPRRIHEGLVLRHKPYYALWSYKVHKSERFDLLGNSLAILCGLASPTRAQHIIYWTETECASLRKKDELAGDLPPNFFPYVERGDPDWMPRYEKYNQPGEYHNGGIWPFICGFYIAALVGAERYKLAEKKLLALTKLIVASRVADVDFGFNEWYLAQDATPQGQDWQTWSAAMYLYAAYCVENRRTPFFDSLR
ncbi:MAG: glycoside hydrolase 100 family protein [Planctomycetota bacterium]|jgi:hypothetical protein